MRPCLIGLTGGIASGKTLIASFFKRKKVPVVDADLLAREAVRPGAKAYKKIVGAFGDGILRKDKTLNRELLGRTVFKDERKRRILEAITHPEIVKLIQKRVAELKKKRARVIVVDAALLFESGLHKKMDRTILVKIRPKTQLKRLMDRDRISETDARARTACQMRSADKESKADLLIDNSGSRLNTRRQFLKIWNDVVAVRRRAHPGP